MIWHHVLSFLMYGSTCLLAYLVQILAPYTSPHSEISIQPSTYSTLVLHPSEIAFFVAGWSNSNSTGCCSQDSGGTKSNPTGFLTSAFQLHPNLLLWHINFFHGISSSGFRFSRRHSMPPTSACLDSPLAFLMGYPLILTTFHGISIMVDWSNLELFIFRLVVCLPLEPLVLASLRWIKTVFQTWRVFLGHVSKTNTHGSQLWV